MGALRVKYGAKFDRIDPAGFRILAALDQVSRGLPYDLTITCGSDSHPASDPHTLGRAYDVRTHDLTTEDKALLVREVLLGLQETEDDAPLETSGGLATKRFFGWLEHAGEVDEHAHFQQRKGVMFP
jgi:hypothetical protein